MDELFDDELRSRLRKYSEEPDSRLWSNIVARNEAEQRPFTLLERKKIGFMVIASLLLMSGIYYLVNLNGGFNLSSSLAGSVRIQEKQVETEAQVIPGNPQPPLHQKIMNVGVSETQPSLKQNQQTDTGNAVIAVTEMASLPVSFEASYLSSDESVTYIKNISDSDSALNVNEESAKDKKNTESTGTENKVANKKVTPDEKRPVQTSHQRNNRFNIYFTIMPTFGYQRINSNSNDNIIIESIDKISTFSMDRLGVRAELGAEDPITERIKVFGGLVYYQRKQTIGFTEKQIDQTNISQGPSGEIIVETKFIYVPKSFEYELRNLGVQLGVSYQLSKKKLLQTAGTGIEFHVALNKLNQSNQTPEITNNPSAYIFYNLYYRLQYPAEGKLRAVLQPTLNYSLYIDQNLNAPFYVKPYGLGLNIGCTYNF